MPSTLETDCLEIGFIDKYSALFAEASGVLPIVLEKPKKGLIHSPGRAHNRIRSPRLAASGQWNKVGKGSRQNRSVTLGKGLALGVGHKGLCFDIRAEQELLNTSRWIVDRGMVRFARQRILSGFPYAVNSQLRTGADNGNPTV